MIAANYRKYPSAMALQLPLPFGRLLVWATRRPTTVVLRKVRALRGAAFKAAGRIRHPEAKPTPSWVREASKRARQLAKKVRKAQMWIGKEHSCELRGFPAHVRRCRESLDRYAFSISHDPTPSA